jgi:hypothetical protein
MKRILVASLVTLILVAPTAQAQQSGGQWNVHTTATWSSPGGSPAQSVGLSYGLPVPLPANLGFGAGLDVARSGDCLSFGLTAGPATMTKTSSYAGVEIQANRSDFYTGARRGFAGYVGVNVPHSHKFVPTFNVEGRVGHVQDAGSTLEFRVGFNR